MKYLLSCAIGLISGVYFLHFPVTSLLFALLPGIHFFMKKNYKIAFICILLSLMGFFYSLTRIEQKQEAVKKENLTMFKGYVISNNENTYMFKTSDGQRLKIYSREKLLNKNLYFIECRFAEKRGNPFDFEKSDFCYVVRVYEAGQVNKDYFEKTKDKIRSVLEEKLDPAVASVMIAMTTGFRFDLPSSIREDFQKTGLVHLLSISGAHFSLLFTFFFLLFKTLNYAIPYRILVRLTLFVKPSQLNIIMCFPVLFFYYLIIEPNYPSIRAFIMSILFMLGVLTERKTIWLKTVSVAVILILIKEPESLMELSFQLSFLATIAIGFATDFYKSIMEKIKNKILSYLVLTLLISFSASLLTAPLVAYKFHYLSLISPLANLTVGLLIGLILFPLNVISVIVCLISGIYPFAWLINSIAHFSFNLMHILSSMKFASISVPPIPLGSVIAFYFAFFLMMYSIYGIQGKLKKAFLLLCFGGVFLSMVYSLVISKMEKTALKVTFLDVGQAESIVIETPSDVFLIDTGKTGYEAINYLKAKGHKNLQALIITHEQKDHSGGFHKLFENIKINEIWDNGFIDYLLNPNVKLRSLTRGDVLKTEDCTFTVLHPYKEFYDPSINKDSNNLGLILKLNCFKNNYLFTADAEKEALESIPSEYLKAEILKIPHHGSRNSFYKEFYEAVSPHICVISVGRNNIYGHPSEHVIGYIKNKCKIYRTDRDGAIQVREKSDGKIEILTFEESKFKPYEEWNNLKKLFILW